MESATPVVPMPRWSTYVGCARVALAFLVLVFTAAATGIWGGYPEFGLALFTAAATLIIFAYYFVALSQHPTWYNRWVILGLEIFGVIFWLVTFALLAHWASFYNDYWFHGTDSYGFWHATYGPDDIDMLLARRTLVKRGVNKYQAGVALAGTAAGLGGVEFGLFVLTLVVFSIALHKQRIDGQPTADGSAMPRSTTPPPETSEADYTPRTTKVKPNPEAVAVTV